MALFAFRDDYRAAKAAAAGDRKASRAVNAQFKALDPAFYQAVKDRRSKAYKAFNKLRKARARIWRERQQARINSSILGRVGMLLGAAESSSPALTGG